MKIGIIHPGEMGISVAASAVSSGNEVSWCSAGRSEATRHRAMTHGLKEATDLKTLCLGSDLIISVCPPHAALQVAEEVAGSGFEGLYADANAISPRKVQTIATLMTEAGIDFVDGGIIGLPAWQPNATWLYLSGPRAADVAGCFSNCFLETEVIGREAGKASALKMCFAANSKGMAALWGAILACAESFQVRDALENQWQRYDPDFPSKARQRVQGVARKAWRFSGEMLEIGETLDSAGIPDGFFTAAADIYQRQSGFKDRADPIALEDILQCLKNN